MFPAVVSIQKAFLVVVVLKIISSVFGWALGMPWTLGFFAPLAFMALYIWIGLTRRSNDVSAEKFADSCYYLGFIFTIASIIISLIDLPKLGGKLDEVAVRFGAAMVSTVLGLIVRVYLVNFRPDAHDALRNVEDALIDAATGFRVRLETATEQLNALQQAVDDAARAAVVRLGVSAEEITRIHSEKMAEFFASTTEKIRLISESAGEDVQKAGVTLQGVLDTYSTQISSQLGALDQSTGAFTSSMSERLSGIQFPDDYFATRLSPPVQKLADTTDGVAVHMDRLVEELRASTAPANEALNQVAISVGKLNIVLEASLQSLGSEKHIVTASEEQTRALNALTQAITGVAASAHAATDATARQEGMLKELSKQLANATKRRGRFSRLTAK